MYLVGIDIGTTNSKAGLFDIHGRTIRTASRPTTTLYDAKGWSYYDPEQMWQTIVSAIKEALEGVDPKLVACIGIVSMAESGLLVDRSSGKPKSPFMPWFDTCSQPQASFIADQAGRKEGFQRSGLHLSFKHGLPKLLWIQEHSPQSYEGEPVWLSASGYIAYRLSGVMATDYSLAARTYTFDLASKSWDEAWIKQFGLRPEWFPPAYAGGTVIGHSQSMSSEGIPDGIPVSISGHDHVAAALAVGAIRSGVVYNSMGTAETMVGTLSPRSLGEEEYALGISFGIHVVKDQYFWMGGNASSGGSVEWLRQQLSIDKLDYSHMMNLLKQTKAGPTGILYYPYLSGSGAPAPDPKARAAMIGFRNEHSQGDLMKAVLEGTSYQLESIKRSAERLTQEMIDTLVVVGGGARNPHWLQIKADITGCKLKIPAIPEASLLGAAMAAGIGCGLYQSPEEAVDAVAGAMNQTIEPDETFHKQYEKLYLTGYEPLQAPLRAFHKAQ